MGYKKMQRIPGKRNGMKSRQFSFASYLIFSYFEKTSAYEYHTQPNSPYRVLQILVA